MTFKEFKAQLRIHWHSFIKTFGPGSHRVCNVRSSSFAADGTMTADWKRSYCECGYGDEDGEARRITQAFSQQI